MRSARWDHQSLAPKTAAWAHPKLPVRAATAIDRQQVDDQIQMTASEESDL